MYKARFCKSNLMLFSVLSLLLGGCSTNPATGESQFDAFMPRGSEASIGAQQHEEIVKQYGGVYKNPRLQAYLDEIGQSVARNTERTEVKYTFTLLDSPVVNAFALPGGYVYVTRGLMAVANDEAELASVLGHEIGHVTARHQASRYSRGLLTTLGATVVGAAVGDPNITRALSLGNNLYMSSYSRDQESQADMLGIRYLDRAGYDTFAMGDFLDAMGQYTDTESRVKGEDEQEFSYFSSHPKTADRVARAAQEAGRYPKRDAARNRDRYLSMIDGMSYGDSADQGFIKGSTFYHPKLGFTVQFPPNYKIVNQPDQLAAVGQDGTVIVLDMAANRSGGDPLNYMVNDWMRGQRMNNPESVDINGLSAATDAFQGTLNGRPVMVRVVAIQWTRSEVFRFQMAIPQGVSGQTVENLKRTTYSFRRLSPSEASGIGPQRIALVRAGNSDTVESLARQMQVDKAPVEQFRALNNLTGSARIQPGQKYKVVVD